MVHRSKFRLTPARFGTLLLAGTAISAANAQPSGYWLAPTVLANAAGAESVLAVQQKPLKTKAAAKQNIQLFLAPEPDWKGLAPSLDGLDKPVAFSDAEQPATVSFKTRGGSVEFEPSVNAKVGRLADGLNFGVGDVSAEAVGFDAQLFNGRITFSTDIAMTNEEDTRDFRDTQLRDRDRSVRLSDTSRRHRFTAKLIDTENLRLLVDGDFGETSEGFATTLREMPTSGLVLPGSWSNMSTSLEFGEARVKVDYKDHITSREALKRQGLTLGYASSALSIYRKDGSEFNLIKGGQWLKRTSFSGINADVIVADVLPDAVADAIDPIRPFLPTSINAGFERGDVVRAELLPGPRDRVQTANASLTWDTRLGETTASAWERRVNTDIVLPGGEDKIPLSSSRDRYIDISHKVRRGSWQFGAGLSMIETDDTIAGVRSAQSEIAPHISVAYAPENGPKIELRYGAADARSQIIDDNLAARAKTKQLQLSVDISSFAQESLNKPDATLKLEYRYDLNGSDRDPVSGREQAGGHAVLLTFSTPLN
jgi:hypothetical protein